MSLAIVPGVFYNYGKTHESELLCENIKLYRTNINQKILIYGSSTMVFFFKFFPPTLMLLHCYIVAMNFFSSYKPMLSGTGVCIN
jgi:hypothetical protein